MVTAEAELGPSLSSVPFLSSQGFSRAVATIIENVNSVPLLEDMGAGDAAWLVECLASTREALSLVPNTA